MTQNAKLSSSSKTKRASRKKLAWMFSIILTNPNDIKLWINILHNLNVKNIQYNTFKIEFSLDAHTEF